MTLSSHGQLPTILRRHQRDILTEWIRFQMRSTATRRELISEADLERESSEFLNAFIKAAEAGGATTGDLSAPEWQAVREMLEQLSRSRAQQGFSPSETATFVLSLKQPIFDRLRREVKDVESLADET